jgi:threonyl-tRNA synthetase
MIVLRPKISLAEQNSNTLWLSPVQARVLPISDAHAAYAKEVFELMKKANIRTELDDSNETLGKKIRDTKTAKIPYTLVIGDQEVTNRTATLEGREGKVGALPIDEIILKLADEIEKRA